MTPPSTVDTAALSEEPLPGEGGGGHAELCLLHFVLVCLASLDISRQETRERDGETCENRCETGNGLDVIMPILIDVNT